MPFVNIRIVKQVIEHDPEAIKQKVTHDVTKSISEAAGIPAETSGWSLKKSKRSTGSPVARASKS